MGLKIDQQDDFIIIFPDYKISGGPEMDEVDKQIDKLIKETDSQLKIIIDFQKIEWLNSSGLGILMTNIIKIKNNKGQIKLANVSDRVVNLFKITKLMELFKIYPSVKKAKQSFD